MKHYLFAITWLISTLTIFLVGVTTFIWSIFVMSDWLVFLTVLNVSDATKTLFVICFCAIWTEVAIQGVRLMDWFDSKFTKIFERFIDEII